MVHQTNRPVHNMRSSSFARGRSPTQGRFARWSPSAGPRTSARSVCNSFRCPTLRCSRASPNLPGVLSDAWARARQIFTSMITWPTSCTIPFFNPIAELSECPVIVGNSIRLASAVELGDALG
jgi:hypothetical protein